MQYNVICSSGTEAEYNERTQLLTELAELDEEQEKEIEEKASAKELQGEEIRAAALESLAVNNKTKRDESKGDF